MANGNGNGNGDGEEKGFWSNVGSGNAEENPSNIKNKQVVEKARNDKSLLENIRGGVEDLNIDFSDDDDWGDEITSEIKKRESSGEETGVEKFVKRSLGI